MTSVADFIKLPKKDFHSSLDLGMRYPSFVTWAGFYVPDFPEDGSPVKIEMRSQVHEYTSMRIATEDDMKKLLFLSISDSFKMFDQNLALTAGGPGSSTEMIALNIYNTAFKESKLGVAQSKAVVFLLVVVVISLTQLYMSKSKEVEM